MCLAAVTAGAARADVEAARPASVLRRLPAGRARRSASPSWEGVAVIRPRQGAPRAGGPPGQAHADPASAPLRVPRTHALAPRSSGGSRLPRSPTGPTVRRRPWPRVWKAPWTPVPHARQRAQAMHPRDRAPFPGDNPEGAWLASRGGPGRSSRAGRAHELLCTLTSESSLMLSRFRVEEM